MPAIERESLVRTATMISEGVQRRESRAEALQALVSYADCDAVVCRTFVGSWIDPVIEQLHAYGLNGHLELLQVEQWCSIMMNLANVGQDFAQENGPAAFYAYDVAERYVYS